MISNNQHFAVAPPKIDKQRSKFQMSYNHKTTMNFGELVPIFHKEMLPGDTFVAEQGLLARMSTPIHPVMDNSFLDVYYFFCPNRLVWEHWQEFMGENTNDAWTPKVEYSIPQAICPDNGFQMGSIADYFGLPINLDFGSVSALPFRAYTLIYNEWFRSEALQSPAYCPIDDTDRTALNYRFDAPEEEAHTGATRPFNACRFHDYFSSALPQPQRGPDVLIPFADYAPVLQPHENAMPFVYGGWSGATGAVSGLMAYRNGGMVPTGESFENMNLAFGNRDQMTEVATEYGLSDPENRNYLEADLRNLSGTINQLRMAFQLQRLLEADARGGGRYIELIKSHFGVTSPDYRLQRPEFIGGKRVKLNMQQVLQNSATTEVSPQGNTAAYSLTSDADKAFTYSATEHGYIIGLAVARTQRSYQQGIERSWSRKSRYDFYWPELACIGEMPILNKELYAQGNEEDDKVFGYQEPWADYKYTPNRITGAFRSDNPYGSLDVWHYADFYDKQPILGPEWIQETAVNVDRTLAVSSTRADQIIMDYVLKIDAVRPIPLYSVPGMADHF